MVVPLSHPFLDEIFPSKPSSYWGIPMTSWKPHESWIQTLNDSLSTPGHFTCDTESLAHTVAMHTDHWGGVEGVSIAMGIPNSWNVSNGKSF